MSAALLNFTIKYETIVCCSCSIQFAVESSVKERWIEKGNNFYCPNGHGQCFTESDIQRLNKKLAEATRSIEFHKNNAINERAAREHTERRLSATKAAKTKLRNRIKNGVCPCCTRSFTNLKRHIETKHPTFQPSENIDG